MRSMTDEGDAGNGVPLSNCGVDKAPHPDGSAAHLLPRGEKGSWSGVRPVHI
jgi:hypothetical protein